MRLLHIWIFKVGVVGGRGSLKLGSPNFNSIYLREEIWDLSI